MHAYQWFFLGIMAAYTPCLIFLAFMLRDIETDEPEPSRVSTSRVNSRLYRSRQTGNIR